MKCYNFLERLFNYCRVSILVIIIGGLFLNIDQGTEVTVRLGGSALKQVFFIAAVAFWAWQSWFWSRTILNDRFPNPASLSATAKATVDWFPRLLGALAFVLAVRSMWQNEVRGPEFFFLSAVGVVSFVYWWGRGKIPRQMFSISIPELKPTRFTRFTWAWFTFSSSVIIGLAAWAILSPVTMGFKLGSGAVVFVALASVAAVGNTLVFWTKRRGFPLVLGMFLIAGIWSLIEWSDNHDVRSVGAEMVTSEPLADAVARWQVAPRRVAGGEKDTEAEKPLVVVATSGGGLRAAYWTATVLGALQDADPRFADSLFAISGVSGGSLGAVVFEGLLASGKGACNRVPKQTASEHGTCFEALGQKALSEDFLAPSVTAMMYGDLMQRFMPFFFFDDRAKALERGWEAHWRDAVQLDLQGRNFRELWKRDSSQHWLPALLLNGTHQETGRRMITSSLAIDNKHFPDAFDFFAKGSDGALLFSSGAIGAATAAHNSARFSYISPAGTLRTGGHIIDGGYFENFGAQTLEELLDAVLNGERHQGAGFAKLGEDRPVLVIQITNDPATEDILMCPDPMGADDAERVFNEIAAPVRGLLHTREARGVSAAKRLRYLFEPSQHAKKSGRPKHYAHFRLQKPSKQDAPKLALGWVLSTDSERLMRSQLRTVPDNQDAFKTVVEVLAGKKEASERGEDRSGYCKEIQDKTAG